MSQLKVNAISDAAGANGNAITLATDGTCTAKVTNSLSNRRLNINGAMEVAQRGTTAGITSDGYFGPDRYKWQRSGATVTISQDTQIPAGEGFFKSLRIECTGADDQSATAGALHMTHYYFEGQDVQRLKYGSGNAKTLKLTFWIRSPKTGTHWVRLYSDDSGRMNNKKYTVSSANTWEKKTLTFAGDTSSGFTADTSTSLRLSWWWSAGSNYTSGSDSDGDEWATWNAANAAVGQVNCMDSTSNNIYLTGVQLEETTATDFEHKPYNEELALCQRYLQMWTSDTFYAFGRGNGTADFVFSVPLNVPLRASPTISMHVDSGNWKVFGTTFADNSSSTPAVRRWMKDNPTINLNCVGFDALVDDRTGTIQANFGAGGNFKLTSEVG